MNREAANDAWLLRLAEGRWRPVQYADGPVPRVSKQGRSVVSCYLSTESCKRML